MKFCELCTIHECLRDADEMVSKAKMLKLCENKNKKTGMQRID